MTYVPPPRRPSTTSAPPQPQRLQRQLSMAFETQAIHGMSPSERATAIAQLAILLLQASGVQAAGSNDDEL